MTIAELQERTDFPFECFMTDGGISGEIVYAAPIPSPYGDGLRFYKNEDGTFSIDDMDAWTAAWKQYIASLPPKRRNRTRKKAEEENAITELPEHLALITARNYTTAMIAVANKTPRLQPLMKSFAEALQQNSETMLTPDEIENIPFIKYYDNSPQAVSNIDTTTLLAFYSIFLMKAKEKMEENPNAFMKKATSSEYVKESIKIYIPSFFSQPGQTQAKKFNKSNEMALVSKIASYATIYGVMEEKCGNQTYKSHYAVLQLVKYDEKNNIVEVMSPYFHALIEAIMRASIEKTQKDKPKMKRNGQPFTLPAHSEDIVKSSIRYEKNQRAAEIVCVVATVIERCGNGGPQRKPPHIKVKTIIARCPALKAALDAAKTTSDKCKILRRAFSKAWDLLDTQTTLKDHYKNIQFPTLIPTTRSMNTTIEFPHDGVIEREEEE